MQNDSNNQKVEAFFEVSDDGIGCWGPIEWVLRFDISSTMRSPRAVSDVEDQLGDCYL